ncbi:MAG TPA: serine protease [Solirubrobacterales bacterium]|nr:serine protease [Solirubrobacterales bacterium]
MPAGAPAAAKGSADRGASASVVGGSNASAASFPWQVLITANDEEFCGGVLIHPKIVLTAAHCLVDDNWNYYEDLEGVTFRAYTGRTRLNSGGEELDWKVARADPDYDPDTNAYDWGFISLNSPASAPTLKLAGPNERSLWEPGRAATVSGFGDLSDGGQGATILQKAKIPLLADSGCSRYGASFHSSTQLCAGYLRGGRDACQGDSGGPLSVTADHGERRLVGLVSTGRGCAEAGFPGIYSKVAGAVNSDRIQQEVKFIETEDDFGAAYTGINVIGSGARPLGCSAAVKSGKTAAQKLKSAERRLKAARRSGRANRIEAARRGVERARHKLGRSRVKSRKACT